MKNAQPKPRLRALSAMAVIAGLALVGCTGERQADREANTEEERAGEEDGRDARQEPMATAELADPAGEVLGNVEFYNLDGGETEIVVAAENLESAGFYGFHVHQVGECEADSQAPDDPENTGAFLSAGSHIPGGEDVDHPEHAGDLPVLLATQDGTAQMSVVTDRLDESTLLDEDGSAVILHSNPDNYANVPERYLDDSTPDEDTLGTGDAGARLACGVIE